MTETVRKTETAQRRVALVTGANKGLGFEISRQLAQRGMVVVITARDTTRGTEAAAKLVAEGLDAHFVPLDAIDAASVAALPGWVQKQFGRLDVLVNNAAINLDPDWTTNASETDPQLIRQTMETNVIGIHNITRALLPLLRQSKSGRVVNMSSGFGSITERADPSSPYAGRWAVSYTISKAALNMLTVLYAQELKSTSIKVNAACPGWVRTDMGSEEAPLSPEEGADTPVWLATLPADGPTGGFFNSRQPIKW